MTDSKTTTAGDQVAGEQTQDTVNGTGTDLAEYNSELLDSKPGLREAFMMMLVDVPEGGVDADAAIVGSILGATRPEDVDMPWRAEGMREWADIPIVVKAIKRMASDYTGGLGCYLVCNCADTEDGTEFVLTTGSVSIVAQLVKLYTMGALPRTVKPVQASKPTKNGYLPMHLDLLGGRARK